MAGGNQPSALRREIVVGVTRHIALLRGINVGGNKRIAMSDLRELMARLGYCDVKTHLASGNALLTSPKTPEQIAQELERAIDEELCAGIKVVMVSGNDLAKVVAGNPLPEAAQDGSRFLVLFLSGEPDKAALEGISPADFAPEQFTVGRREIYLWCPKGVQDSKLSKELGKRLPDLTVTARNWNTVTKLLELAEV